MKQDSLQDKYAEQLPGRWYIIATNFPLWLTGKRLRPTFNYTVIDDQKLVLKDDVSFLTTNGKKEHILGTDTYNAKTQQFTWRGKGLLRLFKSQWSIRHISPDGRLMVIEFTKSIITPAGIDIICRDSRLPRERKEAISLSPDVIGLTVEENASLIWLSPNV